MNEICIWTDLKNCIALYLNEKLDLNDLRELNKKPGTGRIEKFEQTYIFEQKTRSERIQKIERKTGFERFQKIEQTLYFERKTRSEWFKRIERRN